MAGTAQAPSISRLIGDSDGNAALITWNLTTANTDGVPVEFVQFTDLCWQSFATNQGGATATIQGSNDGTNYFSLTNAAGGTAMTFAADGGKQAIERPRYVRPSLTTAGSASVIAIVLLARRNPSK